MGTGMAAGQGLVPIIRCGLERLLRVEIAGFGPVWGSTGGPAGFQLWSLSHQGPSSACFGYVTEPIAFLVLGPDPGHPLLRVL